MVHAGFVPCVAGAPKAVRLKHQLAHWLSRRAERQRIPGYRLIIANSQRTRHDLVKRLRVPIERTRVVYHGIDRDTFQPATPAQRRLARHRWHLSESDLAIVFVGALGYDSNKGLDTLLAALGLLHDGGARCVLLAAGAGQQHYWHVRAAKEGVADRVRFIGHTSEVPTLLAAADLLVSPTRYDSYGLVVHEALCCGVPAIVSACAGVAERYPDNLRELLLPDPENSVELAQRIRRVVRELPRWRRDVEKARAQLQQRTWNDAAGEIVQVIRSCPPPN
jgi:glycosyltransferase involved in cell wall biosynthesis